MRHTISILLITLSLTAIGCSKKGVGSAADSGSGTAIPTNPAVPPVTDPTTVTVLATGTSVSLNSTREVLSDYVNWSISNPTDLTLEVSLKNYGTVKNSAGSYDYMMGGVIRIKFKDGVNTFSDEFTSLVISQTENTVTSNVTNNKYNLFSTTYPNMNGEPAYHGFFDSVSTTRLVPPSPYKPILGGAIILVIDQMNDSGDGQGPTSASGSVWYKNYYAQYPMGFIPNTSCWNISKGPYQCRAWASGNGVNTKQAVLPDANSGYAILGTFTGLNIRKAFNME